MSSFRTLCALFVLITLAIPAIAAEEKDIATQAVTGEEAAGLTYGASVQVLSKYVTRGAVVSDDPVLQPDLWVTYGDLTFGVWNNIDLTDYEVAPWRVTETDWYFEYGFSVPKAELAVGYFYYTYPNLHVDDTQEVYAKAAFDVFLSPEVAVYYDIDEIGGIYANASASYAISTGFESAGEGVDVKLGAMVGYGDSNYIGGCFDDAGSSFVDLVLSCEVPVKLAANVTLTPAVAYMHILDDDLRECTDISDALYGGIGIAVDF